MKPQSDILAWAVLGPEPVIRNMHLWGCWPVLADHKLVGIYSATALGTQIRAFTEPRQCLLFLDTRVRVSLWTPACVAASRPACGKMKGWPHFPEALSHLSS